MDYYQRWGRVITNLALVSVAAGILGFLALFTGIILFTLITVVRESSSSICKSCLSLYPLTVSSQYTLTYKRRELNFGGKQMGRGERGWIPDTLWSQVKGNVPITCVDVILFDSRGAVLLGWRVIHPYVNVWALPGGRIRMGEDIATAARRILSSHNILANDFCLVGVFPIRFPSRFDVSICVAAGNYSGTAVPDGTEFKKVRWFKTLPKGTGQNYRKMIEKWRRMRRMPQVVKFNEI